MRHCFILLGIVITAAALTIAGGAGLAAATDIAPARAASIALPVLLVGTVVWRVIAIRRREE